MRTNCACCVCVSIQFNCAPLRSRVQTQQITIFHISIQIDLHKFNFDSYISSNSIIFRPVANRPTAESEASARQMELRSDLSTTVNVLSVARQTSIDPSFMEGLPRRLLLQRDCDLKWMKWRRCSLPTSNESHLTQTTYYFVIDGCAMLRLFVQQLSIL